MPQQLKIGGLCYDSDYILSHLGEFGLLEPVVGKIVLSLALNQIEYTREELYYALSGSSQSFSDEEFHLFIQQWCQTHQKTIHYIETVLLQELKLEKFKQSRFSSRVSAEFMANRMEYDQLYYSMICLGNADLAREIYFQLRDGEVTFQDLIVRYDPDRQIGAIGPVTFAALPVSVRAILWAAKPKEICPPIVVGDDFWIVQLEQKLLARLTTSLTLKIRESLFQCWLSAQTKQALAVSQII